MGAYFDHGWWSLLFFCAASAAVTALVLRLLLTRLGEFALDAPNHRSLHETPVPRTGGWGLLSGAVVGFLLSQPEIHPGIVFAFVALLVISLADDLRSLSARVRFSVQILSVGILLYVLAPPFSGSWSSVLWPLLVLGGVWVVNLYNFMDGMDGFAGSMTAIGFATLGVICFLRDVPQIGSICLLIATSSVVFLYYNWPRAQIFLGDAGSTVIGLAAFAVSIAGWQQGAFGVLIPLLVFLPFWLDASATLAIRVLRRERWWEAHRQHFYQRMALKHGVKTSLFIELAVMLSTSLLALLLVASGVL